MKFKFKNAELPTNNKKDFDTDDTTLDIICRIYLAEAPSQKHERVARELDGENYESTCFYIESVVGRNEVGGDILTSGWMLYYIEDNERFPYEFGYVADDINGAWEFFKKDVGVEF